MVVGVNVHMKMPIGYFLIDGWTAQTQKEKVVNALEKLHAVGIKTIALTCDGLPANINTFNLLGACIDPTEGRLSVSFPHPVDRSRIYVVMDACHMLKLVRNILGKHKRLVRRDGKVS